MLGSAEGSRCILIAISTQPQQKPGKLEDVGWASLTWTDIDDLAREAHEQLDGRVDPVPRYLLKELRQLLMNEELVFQGFLPQQLGDSAGHALSAYRAWYELVKLARRQLRDQVVPRSKGRETLRRSFNGVGFDAVGTSWDQRKVRRTKLHLWVGVYPFHDNGDYPTDWYAGTALYFASHPQKLRILEDRAFMRAVGRFCTKHGFELLAEEFTIRGDNTPATKLLRGCRTPAAQQQGVVDYWTRQLRAFNDSEVVQSLLGYH